ncbi:MAG: cytochrome ubiquinol oxidase subunit I [Mucinivorans sp.]
MNDFTSVIDWSRAMFALTAIYHWLFVPLTLGLSFIIAFMETKYVRTGDEFWRRTTKFWMRLFGVNFAIGVATGLILEFEFGTNWSNYSYFVGDIFGAPLAIEGIFAFFMESTFIAIMFFGWNKVGKKTHLLATWLTAVGANLSALWILVANAWMQSPVGMQFNPATARNEMVDFWAVVFSPVAINKFFHTVTSAFVLASIFVIGVSAWYLIRKRETQMAIKSIRIAAIFGLLSSVCVIWTGDGSAVQVARVQPMKLAAMEGLYEGRTHAPLTIIPGIEIPSGLSWLSYRSGDAYVAGINNMVREAPERIERGKVAIAAFAQFKDAQAVGDSAKMNEIAGLFKSADFKREYFDHFGYGYLNSPQDIVPPVGLTYWSFRVMVAFGMWFLLVYIVAIWVTRGGKIAIPRFWLYAFLWSIPLSYIASQAGWIVAEVGRQPWTIQDLLPTMAAVSRIDSASVQVTFWLFAALFTALLVAEITILTRQIKKGPNDEN